MNKNRRVTLISRAADSPDRDWDYSRGGLTVFFESVAALRIALRVYAGEIDIERAVVDRAATADGILETIANLPPEYAGDVLFIVGSDEGFLSSANRGNGRILYALTAHDVRFYLETNRLVTGRVVLERTA